MSNDLHPRFAMPHAPGAGAPSGAVDPADVLASREWIELCAKIGFTLVAVKAPWSPELWQNSGFEEDLGRELTDANLGHYDSSKHGKFAHSNGPKYGNPITFLFCLHSTKLLAALQFMKARLAAIGLLPHVRILYVDPDPAMYRRVLFLEDGKAGT